MDFFFFNVFYVFVFLFRQNGDEPVSTLTQDFHTRLDNLLRTLVHAKPHFVRCVRSNSTEAHAQFERATVMRQIRSLQVLETVNLMAGGKTLQKPHIFMIH
jgi:dachs protein